MMTKKGREPKKRKKKRCILGMLSSNRGHVGDMLYPRWNSKNESPGNQEIYLLIYNIVGCQLISLDWMAARRLDGYNGKFSGS